MERMKNEPMIYHAAFAAVVGGIGSISKPLAPLVAGGVNTAYAGFSAYENGVRGGDLALVVGTSFVTTGLWAHTFPGMPKYGMPPEEILTTITTSVLNLSVGAGANMVSAAVYKGVTNNTAERASAQQASSKTSVARIAMKASVSTAIKTAKREAVLNQNRNPGYARERQGRYLGNISQIV